MDPGTLAGVGLTFGAVFLSLILDGASPGSLLIIPAMLLVFGGTFGAAMAGGVMRDSTSIVGYLKRAFTGRPPETDSAVQTLVAMADRARKEGLLALEDMARDLEDPFLRRGVQLTVDGTDPDELRDILEAEIDSKRAADRTGIKLFQDMGGYAPTLGIIGTVIGLVHVLRNLSTPESLGRLIAGAFVATLWGVLSANALWLPISHKLRRLSELEIARMELIIEGILAVQSGTNPRLVQQRLESLLPPAPTKPAAEAAKEAA